METSAFLRITNELRQQTLKLVDDIKNEGRAQKLRSIDQEVDEKIHGLVENKHMVLVVGEVKGGKSSFINAVIGKNLLPVEDEVATSQAIMISKKDHSAYRLVFTDDSSKEIPEEHLTRYACQKTVDENGGILMLGGKQLSHIEVEFPAQFLPANITLVDTPGAGTLLSYHMEITHRFVPQADAVLYVLDAFKPILQSDLNFIEEILHFTPHIFFIQTKIDIIDEWEAVRDRNEELLKTHLKDRLSQPLKVWPISSSQLLKASQVENEKRARRFLKISRYEELSDGLESFLYFVSGLSKTIEVLTALMSYSNSLTSVLKGRVETLSNNSKAEIQQKLNDMNNKKQLIRTNWGLEGQGTKEAIAQMAGYLSQSKQQFWQLFDDTGNTYTMIAAKIEQADSLKQCRDLSNNLAEEISKIFLTESDKFFRNIQSKMQKDFQEIAHWLSQETSPYRPNTQDSGFADFLENIFSSPSYTVSGAANRSWAQSLKASIQKSFSALFLPTVALFRVMDNFFKSAEKLERVKKQLLTITRDSLNDMREKCHTIVPNSNQELSPIDSYFLSLKRDWKNRLNQLLQSRRAELDEEIRRLESQVHAAKDQLKNEYQTAAAALSTWMELQETARKYLLKCDEICQEMTNKEN